jgi:hypothetical protein
MWWGVGFFLALIYIALLVMLGLTTLRNGHTALFWIGFIFPVLWLIGFFMAPTEKAIARGA